MRSEPENKGIAGKAGGHKVRPALVACAAFLCCAAFAPLLAQRPPPPDAQLAEALQPLADGVPAVSAVRLTRYLAGNPPPSARDAARLKLCEALTRSGQPREALARIKEWGGRKTPGFAFWRGQAMASLERWKEAREAYREVTQGVDPAMRAAAQRGMAEAEIALDNPVAARALLEQAATVPAPDVAVLLRLAELLLDDGEPVKARLQLDRIDTSQKGRLAEKRYLEARIDLAQGRFKESAAAFASLATRESGSTERLAASVAVGRAVALKAAGDADAAREVLEEFIEQQPLNPGLGDVFRELDALLAAETTPSYNQLREWARRTPDVRAAWSELLRGKGYAREKNFERAEASFVRAERRAPDGEVGGEAVAELAWIQLRRGNTAGALQSATTAIQSLPGRHPAAARARFVLASAQFELRQRGTAASLFEAAGEGADVNLLETAKFNAARAWLAQGSYERFLDDYKQFSALYPESPLRRELLFEEGLRQAHSKDPRTFETLSVFLRDFPEHRRVSAASLALAENAFLADPPNAEAASYYLKASTDAAPATETDRSDLLALYLAESAGKPDDEVIRLGNAFLSRHATSPLVPQARMKLGELYYRAEDFANAQTQFEQAARETPEVATGENALFLAGQSAVRTMNDASVQHALELFEEVAKRNGPLKLSARREQAGVKLATGRDREAVILYDDILGANPDPEMRYAALMGKGEALFSLGTHDPKLATEAQGLFDQIARDTAAPDRWRNQAVWRKARAQEKSGDEAGALASCYEVLERPSARQEAEYFWFYKAAFDAARLLESRGDWPSSIAVYRKIADRQGPRAVEARERMTRLRLEHFLWED